jgi:uncharacterized protein YjbI with pentapeptide repeats
MSWKMTAEELLERYAAGKRDFAGVDLHGVDLSGAVLRGINLERADLSNVNFSGADLSGYYGRSLSPRFKETSEICMSLGKYSSRRLGNPAGGYSCIRYAVLRNTDFRNSNLSYVDFSHSDLSFANLSLAYGDGVAFEYACLYCVDFTDAEIEISSFEGANLEGTTLENAEWV